MIPHAPDVHIHRSSDVLMTHNVLQNLDIDVLLAHSGTKCVSKDVCAHFGEVVRFAAFLSCLSKLLFIVRAKKDVLE